MIKDTCCCGAVFEVVSHTLNEASRHGSWLQAHEVCRKERGSAVAWLCEWDDDKGSYCKTLSWTPLLERMDNNKVQFTPLYALEADDNE